MTAASAILAAAQPAGFNYDEEKVPPYQLPDLLAFTDGRRVSNPQEWKMRRTEILTILEAEEYGKAPPLPARVKWKLTGEETPALNGLARRKQVTVYFSDNEAGHSMDVLIFLPAAITKPVPLFWGLNFEGNHGTTADTDIPLCRSWMRNNAKNGITDHRATEQSRGSEASRYPLELALRAGYGVATAYYGDIAPDDPAEYRKGVMSQYPKWEAEHGDGAWGSVAAWAWGLRLGMSYFETDSAIDSRRIICMGHSRLGKTALWAGATDERFALVISNDSGCGGAALSKRVFGETVDRINTSFPHWFCKHFRKYNNNESALAFDQHWLLAAIAPRPLLVCSATEDLWADPRGEFLSAFHASPAFVLLGKTGLASVEMPAADKLLESTVGYHLRTGKHDVTPEDWKAYIAFANRHLSAQ